MKHTNNLGQSALNAIIGYVAAKERQRVMQPITLQTALLEIAGGKYREQIEALRRWDKKTQRKEYDALKLLLPAYVFAGTYMNIENKYLCKNLSGVYLIDWDGSSKAETEELFQEMRNDPEIFFAFRSPSGIGLKIGVLYDNAGTNSMSDEERAKFFTNIHKKVEQTIWDRYSIIIDDKCSNFNRLCFVAFDDKIHVNRTPELMTFSEIETRVPKQTHIEQHFNAANDNRNTYRKVCLAFKSGEIQYSNHAKTVSTPDKKPSTYYVTAGQNKFEKFAAEYGWRDVLGWLQTEGWTVCGEKQDRVLLTRPGKESGVSGILFNNGTFVNFSSSVVINAKKMPHGKYDAYGVFDMYVHSQHRGDVKAACNALEQRYGRDVRYYMPPTANSMSKAQSRTIDDDLKEADKTELKTNDTEQPENYHLFFENDIGFARFCAPKIATKHAYNVDEELWLIYRGGVWHNDATDAINNVVYDVIAQGLRDAIGANISAEQLTKKYAKWGSNAGINAVLSQLQKQPEIAITTTDFDANPYQVNLINGVLDLERLEFVEHSHTFRFRKQMGAAYNESADCPRWIEFIEMITGGNAALADFLQQLCGVWLTGVSNFQHIVFAYGTGKNGKSTFFTALQQLFNGWTNNRLPITEGYYVKFPIELLLKNKFGEAANRDYRLAKLQGARLAVASELPSTGTLDEHLIKELTGGESISARHPYGRPFTFYPSAKLVIFGNTKPSIKDMSEGFWRRMLLVPFTVSIPENKRRDMNLVMQDFRKESDGILLWALQGWLSFSENGLIIPDVVKDATDEYRDENDTIGDFFTYLMSQGWAVSKNNGKEKCELKNLYEIYKTYIEESGAYLAYKGTKQLSKAIKEAGWTVSKGSGNKTYVYGVSNELQAVF